MGQYYHAYTKNATEERVWSLQCTNFTETRNFDWYVGLKLMEHSWCGNILTNAMSFYLYKNPTQLAWIGDYAKNAEMYDKCWGDEGGNEFNFVVSEERFDYTGKWLVNHTTKEAFAMIQPTNGQWVIYPVSLITACGNGLGGGDYDGKHKMIGKWAMHVLSIEDAAPADYTIIPNPGFAE